ncbi:peroxidase [Striga asiatica]|uniref:peroxidase n=1 Tax=Striga asiatica TaxID=4170 RepID=A0A5A7RCV1_STRAF|nr:peroxidase [Striga asiatica]
MVLYLNRVAHLITVLIALGSLAAVSRGQLNVGFYSKTCPTAESIVRSVLANHFNNDKTIPAPILRMFFHDCFVSGCDGSILLDGPNSEKTAVPNLSLRGFEVIEEAKQQIEAVCPGVVSCADILALAARDSVVLVSGHTIGTAACQFISYRLYNYNNTGKADPTINRAFLPILRNDCPQNGNASKRVPLDRISPTKFDNAFYLEVATGFVVLESDQRLFSSMEGQIPVAKLALQFFGNDKFGKAMNKMGAIEVLTGTNGEIRNVCNATNS